MRPEDVLLELRRRPFVSLMFRLTNGETYTVPHPDLVMVGRSSLHLGRSASDLPPGVFDHYEVVSLIHLAQIIPLSAASAPANGSTE
jgi:hypothetical protein